MNKEALIKNLNELINPMVTELGYELYHVELVKEEGEYFLRIYINNENGISLQDCEKVSRPLSDMLDEKDPIPYSYYLEVSSPGIYRTLYNDTHLNKAIGEYVQVKLNSLFNGKREIVAKLISNNEGSIAVEAEESVINIPKDKIKNISITDIPEGGNN